MGAELALVRSSFDPLLGDRYDAPRKPIRTAATRKPVGVPVVSRRKRALTEWKQRSLEEVNSLSAEEAVEITPQAGIVGAGGGGFPTCVKYKSPQPRLIVNCTESETGYRSDKLLHREYFDEFLELFEALKAIFGIEHVIIGVHCKDEEWFSDYK